MAKISAVFAREILDSRGNPTIETTMWANDNKVGVVASIPSGAYILTLSNGKGRSSIRVVK